jgi:hypothetical protein
MQIRHIILHSLGLKFFSLSKRVEIHHTWLKSRKYGHSSIVHVWKIRENKENLKIA